MIYTILVALDADPLLPRCKFTGLADLALRWLSMIYETRVTNHDPRGLGLIALIMSLMTSTYTYVKNYFL